MSVVVKKCDVQNLTIKSKNSYNDTIVTIQPWLSIFDNVFLPFSKGLEFGGSLPDFPDFDICFIGNLLDRQIDDMKLAKNLLLDKCCVFLSLYCGYGKTICSLYLSSIVKKRTLMITDRTIISDQWIVATEKFTNHKLFQIKSGSPIPSDAPICIVGIDTMRNMSSEDFTTFGTVILDEALAYCTQIRVDTILKLKPRYLIGLSADIDRVDGMHKVLEYFFGERKTFIRKISQKKFQVYKFNTSYKPLVKVMWGGKLDWNAVIDSICYNEERNKIIAEMAILNQHKKVLILCKRIEQCNQIYEILLSRGISSQLLVSKTRNYKNCNVLVSTYSKAGKGFDDQNCCTDFDGQRLNLVILASDITNPEQYIGRVFRSENPTVYYLVDDFASFRKHWNKDLMPWILSRNGEIVEEWL